MVKVRASVIMAFLNRFIGLNGKSVLKVPNAYVAGWKDCSQHLKDHYGIEIEIEENL